MKMAEVVIPYSPRPIWRDVIHPALEKKRRAVLVCHRRFGKTVGCVNELIKKALTNTMRAPVYAYVAPYRIQAKKIAWEYLKYFTSSIPGKKYNESDLFVELPSRHPPSPGARIYIVGADNPDSLRGLYFDGVILDEYAQIKSNLYGEILSPALADRKGFAYFIGTPKGQNGFYDRYLKSLKDDRYFSCLYRVDESGVLDATTIEEMKSEMTETEIRQELYCDFTASASNVVIPIDLVTAAAEQEITPAAVAGLPVILGVDVARFGDDRSVITRRQGLYTAKPEVFTGLDTMALADQLMDRMRRYNPAAVFVDAGAMGAGVIDRCRQMGFTNVTEVSFGGSAINKDRYANIRAEMYFKAREYLERGGSLPQVPELKSELSSIEYKFTRAGKIILQPKEEIKELTGKSPDMADSFVLTFARPVNVASKVAQRRAERENALYDPLAGM